jgi:TP901 family phage tail tape measure protein
VGFGALTAGALSAEAAQGKFMAATGKSRGEADKFVTSMDGLAGSVGTTGMKFEDLAALGTTVEQQFGTTGQKTQDLTEKIAEFAKVTGTDANGAAGDLEDTLSAYGLTADDAAGFTDNLVASSQKYGTETGPAQLQVLRDMSPALQTMGGDLTDGVGFLNLFETAGLDASVAAVGSTRPWRSSSPVRRSTT